MYAIAERMKQDDQNGTWRGTEIKVMEQRVVSGTESKPKKTDPYQFTGKGHHFLIINDKNGENGVLIDYWFAAKTGKPDTYIFKIPPSANKTETGFEFAMNFSLPCWTTEIKADKKPCPIK